MADTDLRMTILCSAIYLVEYFGRYDLAAAKIEMLGAFGADAKAMLGLARNGDRLADRRRRRDRRARPLLRAVETLYQGTLKITSAPRSEALRTVDKPA